MPPKYLPKVDTKGFDWGVFGGTLWVWRAYGECEQADGAIGYSDDAEW